MRSATRFIVLALSLTTAAAFGGEPPESACCVGDACHMLTQTHCEAEGGVWIPDATCDSVQCIATGLGACCFADSGCGMLSEDHCLAGGGKWQGKGSDCASACGGTPDAACCIEFECFMINQKSCLAGGGQWNAGMYCENVVCEENSAYGACCFEVPVGMACVEIHEVQCYLEGGDWQGPHTVCADVECGVGGKLGACCVNGGCLMLMPDKCDSVHGQWSEGHCGTTQCAPWCEGDIDRDGVVGVNDILILLANWGPCV